MKEIFIVRYADDFKIMCRTKEMAQKFYIAIKRWLKDRLGLEVSEEKSKIVNLKTQYSEFLGIKIKTREKNKKRVVVSKIADKAIKKMDTNLKSQLKIIQKRPSRVAVGKYNSMVLGYQNYYKVATHITVNMRKLHFSIFNATKVRLQNVSSFNGEKSDMFLKYYGGYNFKTYYVDGVALFPIAGIKTNPPMNFSQDICDYTIGGRAKIHTNLSTVDIRILRYLMEKSIQGQSNEYNDNRISLYSGQMGL